MTKLHLGCGKRDFGEDWKHVDMEEYPHVNWLNVLSMPIERGTVEMIYASHLLEYFDWEQGEMACGYWRNLLKPGGILRLSVPDWDSLVNLEITYGLQEIIGPLFGRWKTKHGWIYHKCVYDREILTGVLNRAGFRNVRWWMWETEEERERYDDYSQAVKHGKFLSLNLEGVK